MSSKYFNAIKTPSSTKLHQEKLWIRKQIKKIGKEKLERLTKEAIKARKNAYKPYSNYAVGAAILCSSGKIYAACNTEVVTFSQTGHAESNAISKAISEGEAKSSRRFIKALVVCHSGESAPYGSCRQVIAEHCENAIIIDISPKGNIKTITSLKTLFPFAFTPSHAKKFK